MEVLTKYWGFYLVVAPDANRVGIPDLHNALELVNSYREWVHDLNDVPFEKRATQNNLNAHIAIRAFRRVLAARIVVFKLFLDVAIRLDKCLQEKHKRIWLLFQLFEPLHPHYGGLYPFIRIIDTLRSASDDALNELVGRLSNITTQYLSLTPSQFWRSTKRSGPLDCVLILAYHPPTLEYFDQ